MEVVGPGSNNNIIPPMNEEELTQMLGRLSEISCREHTPATPPQYVDYDQLSSVSGDYELPIGPPYGYHYSPVSSRIYRALFTTRLDDAQCRNVSQRTTTLLKPVRSTPLAQPPKVLGSRRQDTPSPCDQHISNERMSGPTAPLYQAAEKMPLWKRRGLAAPQPIMLSSHQRVKPRRVLVPPKEIIPQRPAPPPPASRGSPKASNV